MKIAWLFNHYALPPDQPGGNRHYYLAKHLKEHGWKKYIIASDVNYLTSCKLDIGSIDFAKRIIDGVSFVLVKVPICKGNEFLRILGMLIYSLKILLPQCTKGLQKPSIIIGSSVHPFAALSAYLLSKRHKVPFIFEVRDLWPETLIVYKKIRRYGIIAIFLRYIEKFLYKNSRKIIVTLPNAHEYICKLGIPKDKIVFISNGVNLELFSSIKPKLENQKEFTVSYLGSHGRSNDLSLLIDAMKIIDTEKNSTKLIKLHLVGDGPLKNSLIERAKKLNLSNISFHEPINKAELGSLVANTDCFVILVPHLPDLYKYGISMNKIFDYLACKRPIIIATDYLLNPVQESGAGLSIMPNNPEKLAESIVELSIMSHIERIQMGIKGFDHVRKHYCYNTLAAKYSSVINHLTNPF